MPKDFPFYNPDEHRHIIHLLETKKPQAIVAATSRDPEMVGSGVYPFPLFEDGDFEVPSVYTTDVEGERLAAFAGQEVSLDIQAQRIPATGCNVIARKGIDKIAASSSSPTSTRGWAHPGQATTPAGRSCCFC